MIAGIILFIVFMLGFVCCFAKTIINTRGIIKNPIENIDYKKELKTIGIFVIAGALSFTASINFIYLWANIIPSAFELVFAIICPLFFSLSLLSFYVTFRLHYYKKNLPQKLDKVLFIIYCISIPLGLISLFYSFNGFANYFTYPLVNGLSFTKGFVYEQGFSGGITFYAVCILSGALLAYALSDHKMYQQYGKHNTLDSTFLVAFPAGIIGARLWYVIGNWTVDGFDHDFPAIFRIWDGGLTILGGAIMGIAVGVLWFIWRNKKYSIWVAVDVIVPTILLAQAIGRLGNFFNVEVHGNPVDTSYFMWLPQIFVKNGMYSSTLPALSEGQMYLPLFFIEAMMNVAGYYLISELFGKRLRKITELGDLAFGYIVYYGLVRFILEPLRSESYNMGENGWWSWVFSGLFIIIGMLAIFINHLVRYLLRKKKNETKSTQNWAKTSQISMIIISIVAGLFIGGGITLMTLQAPDLSKLGYNIFNGGIILLVIGIGVLLSAGLAVIYNIEAEGQTKQSEA